MLKLNEFSLLTDRAKRIQNYLFTFAPPTFKLHTPRPTTERRQCRNLSDVRGSSRHCRRTRDDIVRKRDSRNATMATWEGLWRALARSRLFQQYDAVRESALVSLSRSCTRERECSTRQRQREARLPRNAIRNRESPHTARPTVEVSRTAIDTAAIHGAGVSRKNDRAMRTFASLPIL